MKITNLVEGRMTRNPVSVEPHHMLAAAKVLMDAKNFRYLPVMENGKLAGVLSERDLRNHAGYWDSTTVGAAMTQKAIIVTPQTVIEDAVQLLITHRVGCLPVVDQEKLVGILTTTDLLRGLLFIVRALRDPLRAELSLGL